MTPSRKAAAADILVIGGGIVGLATARELLLRAPDAKIVVLEKENRLAVHQTGHNSGVIHAGVYYKPKSLKADLCKRGAAATKAFCTERGIEFRVPGKLIVAVDEAELGRMENLRINAIENAIEVEELDDAQLRRLEPAIAGVGGLRIGASGIVDYGRICQAMAAEITSRGGVIETGERVLEIREGASGVLVGTTRRKWTAQRLIACAGLQSDRLARLANMEIDHQIIPFRGEYYNVAAARRKLVSHMIYPVPDPELPFLGIHLTPMIDGALTVGPNAVLGLSREGYRRSAASLQDMSQYLRFSGLWRVLANHWRSALAEASVSLSKRRYLEQCRKYCPSLELGDLHPREAGIRAQAVMADGTLVHDFLFLQTDRMLHVCNAPSPAATSAMPIAAMIADRLHV